MMVCIVSAHVVCAQVFMARLAELSLGSPSDVLTLSIGDSPQRSFRGRQLAEDDMDEDDINEDIRVNTTIYFLARTLNVTLETDEVHVSKGFRLEFAVSTPFARYCKLLVLFELRCTELGACVRALHALIASSLGALGCPSAQLELLQVRNSSGVLRYPLHSWRQYV